MQIISAAEIDAVLDWDSLLAALQQGHGGTRPLGDR